MRQAALNQTKHLANLLEMFLRNVLETAIHLTDKTMDHKTCRCVVRTMVRDYVFKRLTGIFWVTLTSFFFFFFFLTPPCQERDVAPWYERLLMMRWVVGSILHGGPTELYLVAASVLRLV